MQLFQSSKSSARNKSLSSSTSVHKINDNIALKKKKHYPSPAVPEQYKVETHLCADTSPRMRKARPRRIMILQTMIQNLICNNNYVHVIQIWCGYHATTLYPVLLKRPFRCSDICKGTVLSVNIWRPSWVVWKILLHKIRLCVKASLLWNENYPIFNIKFLRRSRARCRIWLGTKKNSCQLWNQSLWKIWF